MLIIIMNIDNYQQHILSIAQAWVLSQLYHPSCPPVHGHYLWLKWWGVRPSSLWLICKCPLTELCSSATAPMHLLPNFRRPVYRVWPLLLDATWTWKRVETPKTRLQLLTWNYGGSHLCLCIPPSWKLGHPLSSMSARNALITFGRLQAFLIHGERHEDPSGVSGRWRY